MKKKKAIFLEEFWIIWKKLIFQTTCKGKKDRKSGLTFICFGQTGYSVRLSHQLKTHGKRMTFYSSLKLWTMPKTTRYTPLSSLRLSYSSFGRYISKFSITSLCHSSYRLWVAWFTSRTISTYRQKIAMDSCFGLQEQVYTLQRYTSHTLNGSKSSRIKPTFLSWPTG